MSKSYYSLGLMSGTSMDGVDASIIQSDGEKKYKVILDKYFEYPKKYLLTVSQFMKIWYYLSRNSHNYSISSDLVRIISDFLGVSYFQSVMSWKQRLHQQMLESSQ